MRIGGPYLIVAALCERILEEKDGVTSLIRIVDRFIVGVTGPAAPEQMLSSLLTPVLFLAFKSGQYRGSLPLKLTMDNPVGVEKEIGIMSVLFEGDDDRGSNVKVQLQFQPDQPGLYWINVSLGDDVMTRIPLRVIYQRIQQSGSGSP